MKSAANRAAAIPIVRMRDILLVSIQVQLTDHLIDRLKADIAHTVQAKPIRGLVIEVSGVDVFDSYIARSVRDLAHIARLMGVTTVLVGLDPGMAMTLVEMGMLMTGVHTELDLGGALDLLARTNAQDDDDDRLIDDSLADDETEG